MRANESPAEETFRVIVVSAEDVVLPEAQQFLAPFFDLTVLAAAEELPQALAEGADALVLDLDTAASDTQHGLKLIKEIRQTYGALVLVALTRSHSRRVRLQAAQAGGDEFFEAPVDFRELRFVLERALERRRAELQSAQLQQEIAEKYSFGGLIGGSEPMRRVYDAIKRVADSNTTVLIRGESGTGKELVARAIVACGPRSERPFVSVNCSALPETLIETELFGHEKGAYTGADTARPGHIELAHTGTLFLDEIATVGLALQTKLLRVLEDHAVTRIGGKTPRKIDFRLLTATNEDLEDQVRLGRFREDLYYRINVVPIQLPPLRERAQDVALLLDHFLRIYCAANGGAAKNISPEVLEILEEYPWPGNVRELENLVQRLVLMVDGPMVCARHLPQPILYSSTAHHESLLIPDDGINFEQEIAKIKTAYLEAALSRAHGKKVDAAALLHIPAQKMKYLCRKFNVQRVKT
jgi:DNA-binding NtrC family response regulator